MICHGGSPLLAACVFSSSHCQKSCCSFPECPEKERSAVRKYSCLSVPSRSSVKAGADGAVSKSRSSSCSGWICKKSRSSVLEYAERISFIRITSFAAYSAPNQVRRGALLIRRGVRARHCLAEPLDAIAQQFQLVEGLIAEREFLVNPVANILHPFRYISVHIGL